MAIKHWPLGGSTASRTYHCPAWAALQRESFGGKAAPDNTNSAATRGTFLHDALQWFIENNTPCMLGSAETYLQSNDTHKHPRPLVALDVKTLDQGVSIMVEKLGPVVEWLSEYVGTSECEIHCELDFSAKFSEHVGGTSDVSIWFPQSKHLVTLDYKSGDGELKKVGETLSGDWTDIECQTVFYSALALDSNQEWAAKAEKVTMGVLHAWRGQFVPSTLTLAYEEFENAWFDHLLPAFQSAAAQYEASKPDMSTAKPGPHCHYCHNLPFCSAATQAVSKAVRLNVPAAKQLAAILSVVDLMEKQAAAARKLALDSMMGGTDIEGFKIVKTQTKRVWDDAALAMSDCKGALGMEGVKPAPAEQPLTPKQFFDACSKAGIEFDATKNIKNLDSFKVVPQSDKRQAHIAITAMADALGQLKR